MRKTNELPFYEMIEKAVSGDKIAIIDLLKYYDAYISKVCLRPLYNKSSKVDMIVDEITFAANKRTPRLYSLI